MENVRRYSSDSIVPVAVDAESIQRNVWSLFDRLVGAGEERWGKLDTNCGRSLCVQD